MGKLIGVGGSLQRQAVVDILPLAVLIFIVDGKAVGHGDKAAV